MKLNEAIEILKNEIENPNIGLPEDIFYFLSTIIPMINVDLLIKNEKNQILLSWRDDKYCNTGWHIPGSIIRFKESITERVIKTVQTSFVITHFL